MSTNKQILYKGVSYLGWALPMLFIGPSIIYNAFQNKQNDWHYLVLGIGILVCASAVYLMFRGFKTIIKSMFRN
jgi:membrane protein DedA with SNARE-associated domain